MPELTSELQQMAAAAARQARPPAVADIIRQGDRRRRRSRTWQSLGGLSVAGVVGTGVALGLGLAGSAPAHRMGTIRTAAFTLVANANGTATLTINPSVLLEPRTLQSDLAKDGIPAVVTTGSFCSSHPAPAGLFRVMSYNPGHGKPPQVPGQQGVVRWISTVTINPSAIPAGTKLSFGNFRLPDYAETAIELIGNGSYTCTSTAPSPAALPAGRSGMLIAPSVR